MCSYGPGEYFVGVVSRGIPSQFALRVSAASPADEVSTHMRTAAAIVDNLAIMSNMDPHVRDEEKDGERERARDEHAVDFLDVLTCRRQNIVWLDLRNVFHSQKDQLWSYP